MSHSHLLLTLFVVLSSLYPSDLLLFKSRSSTIRIGSFNLRRYSFAKATAPGPVNTYLSKILARYDLVFLQEIIDATSENRVVNQLLTHLHRQSKSSKYEATISPALGSTSYKERLVYLHRKRSSRIQLLSSHVYNGSVSHLFERPPFILHVNVSSMGEIHFVGVHFKPENVFNEFRYLRTVIDELKSTSPLVLLGDFNADCSYLSNAKKKEVRTTLFNDFQWLIDDRTETNLRESCSYDRILISSGKDPKKRISWKAKSNRTFPFDKHFHLSKQMALQISDHYPVEVDLQ